MPKDFSDETAHAIDMEVESLVKTAEQKTINLLQAHREQLDTLANELLRHETLGADEVQALLNIN